MLSPERHSSGPYIRGYPNMPNSVVIELMKEVAVLKSQVKDLMALQKWQMSLLAMTLAAVIGTWVSR